MDERHESWLLLNGNTCLQTVVWLHHTVTLCNAQGAAECVLQRCTSVLLATGAIKPLDAGARKKIEAQIEAMAGQALRCLALAFKVCTVDTLTACRVCCNTCAFMLPCACTCTAVPLSLYNTHTPHRTTWEPWPHTTATATPPTPS